MANSSWKAITNRCLALASLDQIDSDESFNDLNQGELFKYQAQCKVAISLAHDYLSLRARNHFASRLIPQQLAVGQSVYPIDVGLDPENIKFGTWFNVSTNPSYSAQNQKLRYLDYRSYRKMYPVESQIPTGAPEFWVLLPIERTQDSPVHRVRIVPTPDQAYLLEFQAKVNALELADANSKIIFPRHYEHALLLFAWELTETDLGEGKNGRIAMLAEKAANQVNLISSKPQDARSAPRGMKLRSIRGGRRAYNSPRSVDDNGSVID